MGRKEKSDHRVAAPLRSFSRAIFEEFLGGRVEPPHPHMPAMSLFSAAAIGDFGYRQAGFTFFAHAELEERRLAIAKRNHPRSATIAGDLRATWPEVVRAYRKRSGGARPALLTGMSPCQGMSSASAHDRAGKTSHISRDPRNKLPFIIADVSKALKPRVVVIENVPNIMTTRVRDPETGEVDTIAQLLERRLADYVAYPATLQFADFGLPQRRRRTLITFIRRSEPANRILAEHGKAPYPKRTHDQTARKGLLPWVTARDFLGQGRYAWLSSSPRGRFRDPNDTLHFVPRYDQDRFDLVRMIPRNSGRSAYETDICPHCGKDGQSRSASTCFSCGKVLHSRPVTMGGDGRPRLIIGHATSYKRMPPHLPASTITTANGHLGSDSKIHPWENRLLSPRECADLQGIPRSFNWGDPPLFSDVTRSVIGEAIPAWFTFLHGLVLRSILEGGLATPHLLPASAAVAISRRSVHRGSNTPLRGWQSSRVRSAARVS